MPKQLFDHLAAITEGKDPKYVDKLSNEDLKTWSNYMLTRFLSMKPEWVEIVATLQPLTETMQPREFYKTYMGILPRGKQYLRYMKGKREERYESFLIDVLKTEYKCSIKEANEYAEILYSTTEGRKTIADLCVRYGIVKKDITKLKLKL
jgi:hypothetical protein